MARLDYETPPKKPPFATRGQLIALAFALLALGVMFLMSHLFDVSR